MSQEKSLRNTIREMVHAELNEESLVGKWFRKLAKNVEDREFDRLMQSRDPGIRKRLAKINDKIEKDLDVELRKALALMDKE
jgi:hypothetical protein